ncbi:MAG TPA: DUF805 domain-containing protein [Balneolaceae bacterium]|nr:DUF805 domain-containing protein [Balneolaceae bacterium]
MYWYIKVLKNYVEFSGRARRKEYWMFTLINLLIAIAFGVITVMSANEGEQAAINIVIIIYLIYSLAVMIPSIAVTVRRLHDTGRSGWWWFINLVPLIGPVILLVFLVTDSENGENEYGAYPKGSVELM